MKFLWNFQAMVAEGSRVILGVVRVWSNPSISQEKDRKDYKAKQGGLLPKHLPTQVTLEGK